MSFEDLVDSNVYQINSETVKFDAVFENIKVK